MDTEAKDIRRVHYDTDIEPGILDGSILIVDEDPPRLVAGLSDVCSTTYALYKDLIRDVEVIYGRDHFYGLRGAGRKPELEKVSEKYGFSKKRTKRIILRYLQGGCTDYSLVDHRAAGYNSRHGGYKYDKRPGRVDTNPETASTVVVDDDVKFYFNEAIRMYMCGKHATLADAFAAMKDLFFKGEGESADGAGGRHKDITRCPTRYQFYYYARKTIGRKEHITAKVGEKEWDNSYRALLSNACYGIHGVGERVEADILDADIFLSAFDDDGVLKTVGKPHVYMAIDVSTRLIIGVNVTYTNNSVAGARGLLVNIGEDKVKYCKDYGIKITPGEWPSGIYPQMMSFDNGSDFMSDQLLELMGQLGIQRDLQPAAMGSMKPHVESGLKSLTSSFKDVFRKMGVVLLDRKYKETARLNLHDFTRVVIHYVLYHNSSVKLKFDMTREMLDEDVNPTPLGLYEYVKRHHGCRMIRDRRQYIYDCLSPRQGSITRHGILFHTLYYLPKRVEDPDLFRKIDNFKKAEKMDIRYYPDDMGQIYYLLPNGVMVTAALNERMQGSASYKGLTEEELDAYREKERTIRKKGQHANDEAKCALWEKLEKIRDEASKRPAPQVDDMKGMHARERARDLAGKSPSRILDPGQEQDAAVHGPEKSASPEGKEELEKWFDDIDPNSVLEGYCF